MLANMLRIGFLLGIYFSFCLYPFLYYSYVKLLKYLVFFLFIWRLAFHQTIRDSLTFGPISTASDHAKPSVTYTYIVPTHNNFQYTCIESCQSYPMTQKYWLGEKNHFDLPSTQSLKMSWVKVSVEAIML